MFLGLVSHQAPDAVKQQLDTDKWEIVRHQKGPTDSRPRFEFLLVGVGQMTDRGQVGDVELWFYNDRLMSVYFTPTDPSAYFGQLTHLPGIQLKEHQVVALPDGAEVWRVGSATDGPIIEWYDPCLRDEHDSWLMEYS